MEAWFIYPTLAKWFFLWKKRESPDTHIHQCWSHPSLRTKPTIPIFVRFMWTCALNLDLDPNNLGPAPTGHRASLHRARPTLEPNLASLKGCFYRV